MAKYILKRILQAIPLLFIISIICFTFIKLAPYNVIDAMATPNMSEETINLIKAKYGFDKPVIMVILVLSSSLVILGNLLSDILYSLIDPRIRGGR